MRFNSKLLFILILTVTIIFIFSCDDEAAPPDLQDTEIVENTAPTGTAGIGKTVLVGEIAIFEGSAADADAGDTLTYSWSITSVPVGSSITNADIIDASTLNASFVPDVAGEYTVQLTVSDGTDSLTGEAVVKAVGFVIGLNDNSSSHSAYLLNGNFYELVNPYPPMNSCKMNTLMFHDGTVYTAGSYINTDEEDEPVYWIETAPSAVSSPYGYSGEDAEAIELAIEADNDVQLIVLDHYEVDSIFYWLESEADYVENSDAVSGGTPLYNYVVTNLFQEGSDVFQIGIATTEGPTRYFLAKNNNVVVDLATYSPEPYDNYYFSVHGNLLVTGSTDEDSLVYVYGRNRRSDNYYAGYTVNDGDWVDLAGPGYVEGYDMHVQHMVSTDTYILAEMGFGDWTYSVFIDGTEAGMETPHDGEMYITISEINYNYMEEVGGSMFVSGGFHYKNDSTSTEYNVAAVWRDGIIVYEGYDDDPFDGMDYDNAAIVSADFE